MTFSEKLIRLRKGRGLSQEALAEALGVSRQAVSRWEQGAALPDGGKLLPCARYFGVSVDWLLDDARAWEERTQPAAAPVGKSGGRGRRIAGAVMLGLSLAGMLLLGILSSVFPAAVSYAPVGADWVHVYTGLTGFLKFHRLEWLFALLLAGAAVGAWLLLLPRVQTAASKNTILRRNLTLLPIAGQAGLVYSTAQSLWWLNQGREHYWGAFCFSLVPLLGCSAWMAWNLAREQDPARRRKNSLIELAYCAGQLAVGLLTAEAGIGLVGLALNGILCLVYVEWINPRYMGRCFSRKK